LDCNTLQYYYLNKTLISSSKLFETGRSILNAKVQRTRVLKYGLQIANLVYTSHIHSIRYAIFCSKEVGLEVNAEKTKLACRLGSCLVTRMQEKIIIKVTNESLKNVAKSNVRERQERN
jgi:hypothetical protein